MLGFAESRKFFVLLWIVGLFVGLLPIPPVAELVLLALFLAHLGLVVRGRFHRAALLRAQAEAEKAEEEDYRRRRRRRSSADVVADGERPHDAGARPPRPQQPTTPTRH